MPQFTYSATDTTGNVIEGMVSANDMMVAADQVRRMGYTPVRVEVTEGAVPAARPLTTAVNSVQGSVMSGQGTQSALLNPESEYRIPNTEHSTPTVQRPAVLDLSQMYATPEATANTLNTLLAPTPTAPAELATAPGRVMEPWERSVAASGATGQELAAPETVGENMQSVGAANVANVGLTNAPGDKPEHAERGGATANRGKGSGARGHPYSLRRGYCAGCGNVAAVRGDVHLSDPFWGRAERTRAVFAPVRHAG